MEIGTWARLGNLVGIVSRIDDDGTVTVLNPGDRQMATGTSGECTRLPTGSVRARVTVELDVPHGLASASVMRWVAALVDPVLRERALATMDEHGLDPGPFSIDPAIEVVEVEATGGTSASG